MGLAQRDDFQHTYGDYLTWGEDQRFELIDGVAYAMSPAPLMAHQDVAGEIFAQLRNLLQGKPCRAAIAPVDVRFPKADEADENVKTVLQPDVLVVCDKQKFDRRGVRGAPDFVVEVLSQSTAGYDHIMKRRAYEHAGVREYWLVHPVDRIVTIYLLENAKFTVPDVQEMLGQTPITVLPGVRIDWDLVVALLGPVVD